MRILLLLALAGVPLAAGAVTSKDKAEQQAPQICKQARAQFSDEQWKKGPCLSDGKSPLADWVVDVAHSPRAPVDDDAQNQCPAFRSGKIAHFVEVDTDCRI